MYVFFSMMYIQITFYGGLRLQIRSQDSPNKYVDPKSNEISVNFQKKYVFFRRNVHIFLKNMHEVLNRILGGGMTQIHSQGSPKEYLDSNRA